MKKNILLSLITLLIVSIFGIFNVSNVDAASSLPESLVSDKVEKLEYIKNFPVVYKTADNGKYTFYCMNMTAHYESNVTFNKTGVVDEGFIYIINNKPNTGDKKKDFYITQLAVWFYEDYLNNNNFNLEEVVKKYIYSHKNTEDVSKGIYELFMGATKYKQNKGDLKFDGNDVTFTKKGDYYVSSNITVTKDYLSKNVNYTVTGGTKNTVVENTNDVLTVKVPVNEVVEGNTYNIKLKAVSGYDYFDAYYYFNSDEYQKMLFEKPLQVNKELNATKAMALSVKVEYFDVPVSKTDITKAKEVEGATLVIKDANGEVIDTWVSTKEKHITRLKKGEYSLTETIAPDGYKLSSTTVYFKIDGEGKIYSKNESGNYELVSRVIMINELKDVVAIAKLDSKTSAYVSGATLVIKDASGNVVSEFVSGDTAYQIALNPGEYTITETIAPKGYILSNVTVSFRLLEDGSLQMKNESGDYVDIAIINFYNDLESEEEIVVPNTGDNISLIIISGIALLIGGGYYAYKTIKEC